MSEPPAPHPYDVKCPHCNKSFEAKPLEGATRRHSGFKCPHCRLFVPFDRADTARAGRR